MIEDSEIYGSPEKYGLRIVAELEYDLRSYNFDKRIVWRDMEGRYWTARDSGCSCPVPFEHYDRSNIDPLNVNALDNEAERELETTDDQQLIHRVAAFFDKLRAVDALNACAWCGVSGTFINTRGVRVCGGCEHPR